MTLIKVYEKNGNICEINCHGHSGYAEHGKDIVCAGITVLVCNCYLGLKKVLKLDKGISHKQDEKIGLFRLKILDDKLIVNQNVQTLMKTTVLSLEELADSYKNYINLERREQK